MYCPQCGTTNEDDAAFCKACGANLKRYEEQRSGDDATQTTDAGQTANGQTDAGSYTAPPPYQQQYQSNYQTQPPYQGPQGYGPAGYPPAGYQPGGYQPVYNRGPVPNIPSYLGWAIATLILCFWPTGIVAVVYATKVGNLLSMGDIRGAQDASRSAKTWCWVTFGIGIAWVVIAIIIVILVAAAGVATWELHY